MPRRSRSPSALLPLACAALVAASCPRAADAPLPSPSSRPPPAGILRIAYPEEPPSLNPIEARSPAARDILRAVLPSFHELTPDLRYRPSLLAAEPRVSTAGEQMRIEFRIRRDARWSDGRPITVDDVIFTWRAMTDPGLRPPVADGFEAIEDVERRSATEGTLVLSPPSSTWRELFSAGRFVLPAPEDGGVETVRGWDEGPPVAGGPFRIARWRSGLGVRLAANPEAFGPGPLLEAIELSFVPDATTALQLLESGRVNAVAPYLAPGWRRRLEAIPGARAASSFGPVLVHLLIGGGLDARERELLAGSVDRGRFVQVLGGEARPAEGLLVPEQDGAVAAWSRYDGTARGDLEDAGELRLVHPQGELLSLLARYVQAEAGRVGADVEILALDADLFQEEWLPERRFDLALWEARGGAASWLDSWFSPRGEERVTGINDPDLFRLLGDATRAGAAGERALREAQTLLAELAPVLPILQPQITMGWLPGVTGLRPNATADGPLWNARDWSLTGA